MYKISIPTLITLAVFSTSTIASEKAFDLRIDTKANYRNSDYHHFATGLSQAPGFGPAFEHQTVNSGGHLEVSDISVITKWQMSEEWQTLAKIDFIDLYERNPTSGDKQMDLDLFIIRYGTKHTNDNLPESIDFYGQVGKFGKFERQEDRHLESYGLVSTAFNRLEDSGFEFGVDLPIGFYVKASYTTGNPLFFRDPNALAGDNGVKAKDKDPDVHAGMPILYDAEIERFDLSKNPEVGGGIGYRWLNAEGNKRLNVLIFNYQRDMAKTVKLNGTFYGGDLDLLDVSEVGPNANLPIKGNSKSESGLNIWWYQDNLAVFVQYVTQDAASLKRTGQEIELSYAFNNVGNILAISPVFRYSKLEPDFKAEQFYPSPSVTWEWEKIDAGFNLDFNKTVRFTLERAYNNFVRKNADEDNNETLATLRVRYDL